SLGIAGAGGGAVISPNQTLTLEEVPVWQGGLAGSIGQVGQRVGTAVGVAMSASVFFGTLSTEAAHVGALVAYDDAYRNASAVVAALLAGAILFALLDLA